MSAVNILVLAATFVLIARPAHGASYAVGTCKPNLQSFTTITAAVSTVPPGSTIFVCPGTYTEQVTVSKPLTLKGVASGNAARPLIAMPSAGLDENGSSIIGNSVVAAQVLVHNAGPVHIMNLTVDGSSSLLPECPSAIFAGIFYTSGSSGTVDSVTVRNHTNANPSTSGCGAGIWIENAPGPQTAVTIKNSSIHNTDHAGIFAGCIPGESNLTVTITGNTIVAKGVQGVQTVHRGISAVWVLGTITGNIISDAFMGIQYDSPSLTLSGNTISDAVIGIDVVGAGVVKSNKISNVDTGIQVQSASARFESNIITHVNTGINLYCFANAVVTNNTINEADIGIANAVGPLSATNKYRNVITIRTGCTA